MEKPEIQIDISRLSIIDKENTHPDKIIKKDGQYFLNILQAEIERFTALCERAEKDISENSLSEEGGLRYIIFLLQFNLILVKSCKNIFAVIEMLIRHLKC